jgi:hypothetical protein
MVYFVGALNTYFCGCTLKMPGCMKKGGMSHKTRKHIKGGKKHAKKSRKHTKKVAKKGGKKHSRKMHKKGGNANPIAAGLASLVGISGDMEKSSAAAKAIKQQEVKMAQAYNDAQMGIKKSVAQIVGNAGSGSAVARGQQAENTSQKALAGFGPAAFDRS